MAGLFDGELASGWLEKKAPSGLVKGWKNRWFVIVEEQLDAQLKYFTTEGKEELKGTVNLMEILEIVDVVEEKRSVLGGPDPTLRFNIVMKDRTYELLAPNEAQKAKWVEVISSASHVPLSSQKGVNYLFQGYLLKLSGGKTQRQKWDRRYFRLRNDDNAQSLQYFKSDSDSSAQGTIMLSEVTEIRGWSHETMAASPATPVEMPQSLSGWQPSYASRFELKTHGRVFVLAETEAPRRRRSSFSLMSGRRSSATTTATPDGGGSCSSSVGGGDEGESSDGSQKLGSADNERDATRGGGGGGGGTGTGGGVEHAKGSPLADAPAEAAAAAAAAPAAAEAASPCGGDSSCGMSGGSAADASSSSSPCAEGSGSKNAWLAALSQACELEINDEPPTFDKRFSSSSTTFRSSQQQGT